MSWLYEKTSMSTMPESCQNLESQVNSLFELLENEPKPWKNLDIEAAKRSRDKAVSPEFKIVFSGSFSAGKSMLINALLGRELLYSAEGHATGTECYIANASPDEERVELTFLSQKEVGEQVEALCHRLNISAAGVSQIDNSEICQVLKQKAQQIEDQEGGKSKSERAKQADALRLLLEGFEKNYQHIHATQNNCYSMQQFNFANLQEAASYAKRGSNSAVLKRIKYFCHHPLLEDGNVIIDTPGIDAPVKSDRDLTYKKIKAADTSAVICVLKAASEGDMTSEETELLENIRENPGIRDRVFYVFNRIDETWYNTQLRQRLQQLISEQFDDTSRVYQTSALLGFWGTQILEKVRQKGDSDRFGLDSIFAETVNGNGEIKEDTPQFVYAFNNYCSNSGKLPRHFEISVRSYESPNENYVRILQEWGAPLLDQLIADSGIKDFKQEIQRYLREEKRPQLFRDLADDLRPLCVALRNWFLETYRDLESQPKEVEGIKSKRLEGLNEQLQDLGNELQQHFHQEVNNVTANQSREFEEDFRQLKIKMVGKLDELLQSFSVENACRRAQDNNTRHSTVPLLAVLVEAFYYLADALEEVLATESQRIVENFFQRLSEGVYHQDYYRELYYLMNGDAGVGMSLKQLEERVKNNIRSDASKECDRYVRESPRFYDEGTFSLYQFRQVLQETSQSYDCEILKKEEPGIRQLLKLDFEPKVKQTIQKNFRQIIVQNLKRDVLELADKLNTSIIQQYNIARQNLEQTLEEEAREQLQRNENRQAELLTAVQTYNAAIAGINECLQGFGLERDRLPNLDWNRDFYVEEFPEEFVDIKGELQDSEYDDGTENNGKNTAKDDSIDVEIFE